MESIKRKRTTLRAALKRVANQLEALLMSKERDEEEVEAKIDLIRQRHDALRQVDEEIFSELLRSDATEEQLLKETEECDEYILTYTKLKCKHRLQREESVREVSSMVSNNSSSNTHKFRLPPFQFKKFGGEIKDWLPFWSQFKKIHNDSDIPLEDKFQYLLLAVKPDTRVMELVESYPATAENYDKVITSLKSRFGRDDLLIEFYIRELLKIIINNALPNSNKITLNSLFDKIETQIRSLETLGISTDTGAAMLYPLVESCLPEELIRVWQRSTYYPSQLNSTLKDRLDKLIAFIKSEVENEERIALAVEGFGLGSTAFINKSKPKLKYAEQSPPTAAGLLNCDVSAKCVFCNGGHNPERCFKAQKMSLEERRKILAERKACYRCARIGHRGRQCRERSKCVVCGKQHLVILCSDVDNKSSTGKIGQDERKKFDVSSDCSKTVKTESVLTNYTNTPVFLQTLRVKMRSLEHDREIRVILDSGSQRSYILKATAKEFRYPVKRTETIVHTLFGGTSTCEQEHKCYDVRLASLDDTYWCKFEVLDQPIICNDISPVYPGIWSKELQRENITLTDDGQNDPIELLIGSDVLGKLLTGKHCILPCGLVVLQTLLGWVLMGKVPNKRPSHSTTMTVMSLLNKDMLITDLWQLDVLGITDPGEKQSRLELEEATKDLFNKTIAINNEGRYEVTLPWREGHPPLPLNENLARKRLEITIRKLQNTNYYDKYQEVFSEWLNEGIIEEVPEKELNLPAHYLPHRPVIKEESITTKVRPVFDASSKEKGKPALNDCLEKGPNLIELIPAILLRFRKEKFGVTSDIRKAFLQISVNEKDRNFLRFLWKNKDGIEKIYRHRRVVFGVITSPFLLGATINFHLKQCIENCTCEKVPYSRQTIDKLSNSFYVDNCVTSVPDKAELSNFIKEASVLMAEAKFELRGWESNGDVSIDSNPVPLLGLTWNKEKDILTISSQAYELNEKVTKRTILSVTQRIFDPIGFTCPATILPKLILQKMWESKINWDTEVDGNTKNVFQKWVSELSYLYKIEMPRWLNIEPESRLSIHTFCDASGIAYATSIFLRVEKQDSVKICLLQAKSRVVPIKKLSIPRLELMAACIGARLYSKIREVLGGEIENHFWSDSMTVLSWIRRNEEWATFVWNRVQEIRDLTPVNRWKHVPGIINPADLLSRGCSPKYLEQSKWWEGPNWLYLSEDKWPKEEISYNEAEVKSELKKTVISSMLNNEVTYIYSYFSEYQKIIRTIAWIYRFAYNCKNSRNPKTGELSVGELDRAEKTVIKMVQKESNLGADEKQLSSLKVFKDKEDLLRVKTQISRREDLENFRYPYLLPKKHDVVRKLIYDTHVKSCHVGTQGLINILREKYWILGGRKIVRSVISSCKSCKRHHGKSLQTTTTELPMDRVRDAATFEVVGIDLAGPIYTKEGKIWICIFTCAIYRAIHLDVVMSSSTNDFLKTFRRFIARRGRPRIVYTDNGTNFCGAENIFCQLNWDEITKFSSAQRIRWKFNPPSAPWWGGWWERLIGILKQLLRKTLGRAKLTNEEMYTVLCDCEAVINARPLTYLTNEPSDLIALTPAMFIRETTQDGVPDCDSADASALNRRVRYLQTIRKDLRKRFRVEYLGQLQRYNKCKKSDQVSVGDIVLIGDNNLKRIDWPLARIHELYPGKDGQVRLVKLKTANGFLLRPCQRLFPLEGATVPQVSENRDPADVATGDPEPDNPESADPESTDPEPDNPESADPESTDPELATPKPGENIMATATDVRVPESESDVQCKSDLVSRFGRKIKAPLRLNYK